MGGRAAGEHTMTSIIFTRSGSTWSADLNGQRLALDGMAGDIYASMLRTHPDVCVGFRASDIGRQTMQMCVADGWGDVLWMKSFAERRVA